MAITFAAGNEPAFSTRRSSDASLQLVEGVADRPEKNLVYASIGVPGNCVRAVLGATDGKVRQQGWVTVEGRRRNVVEDMLRFAAALGDVEPRGVDGSSG